MTEEITQETKDFLAAQWSALVEADDKNVNKRETEDVSEH